MKRLLVHLALALGLLSYSSGATLAAHRALAHHHQHAHHAATGAAIDDDCHLCQAMAVRVIDNIDAPAAPALCFALTCVLTPVADRQPHADCLSIEQSRAPPIC